MVHEYRERADLPGICAACGQRLALCMGTKPIDLAFLRERPEFAPRGIAPAPGATWDAWCRRYGIDPNTDDETKLDAYLHGKDPRGAIYGFDPASTGPSFTRYVEWHGGRMRLVDAWVGPTLPKAPWVMDPPAGWRDDEQRAFYASWADYDAGYLRMPPMTRDLQDRAERVELERMWQL